MATEKYPWLHKYSASVAASLTAAVIIALFGARHYFPDAFATLTDHLTVTGQYLTASVSVARWLLWSLYAVGGVTFVVILLLTYFALTRVESKPKTALIDDVKWPWTIFANELNAGHPLCPRDECNNELEIFGIENYGPTRVVEWPHNITELSCNRCYFRTRLGVPPEDLIKRAEQELRRRYRTHQL